MLTMVLQKQKEKKFILMNIAFLLFFVTLYTTIDFFNMSYVEMANQFSIWLVIANVFINILMAVLSTIMLAFSSAQFDLTGKESKASNLSFISVLFGILTYGCTPCVISFFAAVGITFGVIALPWAGFPYKLISLAILLLGTIWIIHRLTKTTCKFPFQNK
jgi:MFS family permease